MLSFHHEIVVELFRGNSEIAVELLRTCAGITVDHTRVELGSIDPRRSHPPSIALMPWSSCTTAPIGR
jgi:hypothetical protein